MRCSMRQNRPIKRGHVRFGAHVLAMSKRCAYKDMASLSMRRYWHVLIPLVRELDFDFASS